MADIDHPVGADERSGLRLVGPGTVYIDLPSRCAWKLRARAMPKQGALRIGARTVGDRRSYDPSPQNNR